MRIIDRQIGSSVLLTMVFGLAVLSFVLVLGNVIKELLDLMVNKNLPLGSVLLFMLLVLPFSLTFTIPWTFLTALLMVFGRMSADNELLVLRSSGVSLLRLCAPVFVLALGLSGICLWINAELAPRAEDKMLSMVSDLAMSDPMALLTPDEVIDTFPNHRIYIGAKQEGKLKDIIIFEMDGEGVPTRRVVAKEASISVEPQKAGLLLRLYHARFEDRDESDPTNVTKFRPGLVVAEGAYRLSADKLFGATKHTKSRRGYPLSEFAKYMADGAGGEPLKAKVEYQRRFSLALACVTFALVGVPLGITAHRKETSVGFGIGIAVALAYYSFILFAQNFAGDPQVHPVFAMWLPNILFGLLGTVLFIRLARQ